MQAKYRYLILAGLALLTGILGFLMYQRTTEQQLWGHLPLLLFLSVWALLLLLRSKKYDKEKNGWRHLGLSAWSGLLLFLGFPTLPLTPLLFIGFVPLLLVQDEISKADGKGLFKYAYNTFVLWNILTTFWVANTAFVAGIVAIWLNAFFMCVPFILFHWTKKYTPRLSYLAFIVYWLSFEYLHLNWEISWSWLTLGNSLATFPSWVQWYEYTGALGGSLWILGLNVLAFFAVRHFLKKEKIRAVRRSITFLAVAIVPIIVSLLLYFNYEEQGEAVEVVVVQPNYEPHYEKFNVPEREQVQHFLNLSEKQLTDTTDYLVFPETVFGYVEINDFGREQISGTLMEFVSRYPGLKLISGYSTYRILGPNDPHTRAVRESVRKGETMYYETYNAAVQITSGEADIQHYKKSKLVPGAEMLPYPKIFFFAKPLVDMLEGTVGGYGTQDQRSVLTSSTARIAPVICYESVFGEYVTQYVQEGAQAIFIMTNDGWWDNTAGHRQHLRFASLRAIETRRSIARSANTGSSAFLNQRGDILEASQYDEPIALRHTITLNNAITFYTIWGDMIGRLAVFTTLLLLVNMFVKSRTGK